MNGILIPLFRVGLKVCDRVFPGKASPEEVYWIAAGSADPYLYFGEAAFVAARSRDPAWAERLLAAAGARHPAAAVNFAALHGSQERCAEARVILDGSPPFSSTVLLASIAEQRQAARQQLHSIRI
jgi:hypothetical protein